MGSPAKEVTIRGVTYPSQAEAARCLGMSKEAIARAGWNGQLDVVGLRRAGRSGVVRHIEHGVRVLHHRGLWNSEIARALGCHQSTVVYHLQRAGLRANARPAGAESAALLAVVMQAHGRGFWPARIVRTYAKAPYFLTERTVRRVLRGAGVEAHPAPEPPAAPIEPVREVAATGSLPKLVSPPVQETLPREGFALFSRPRVSPALEAAAAPVMARYAASERARVARQGRR